MVAGRAGTSRGNPTGAGTGRAIGATALILLPPLQWWREPPRSDGGVPALRAQPACSGPPMAQATTAIGSTIDSATAASRARCVARDVARQPMANRAQQLARTTAAQARYTPYAHGMRLSLPVPRPCNTATGHMAQESRWMPRQVR